MSHSYLVTARRLVVLKLIVLALFVSLVAVSSAKPEFLVLLKNHYKIDEDSALGAAGCGICHTSPPARNPYGKELAKLIDASPQRTLTEQILEQAESIDSDGDGWTNGDELKQGFLPGDPSSHPPGTPPPPSKSAPQSSPAPSGLLSLIPTHGFHPVVVHFPIALFIFGVVLEFFGLRRKESALGTAALWNLSAGLLSLSVVVPTGIAAWLLGGHKLEGNMLIHMILAASSLLLMVGVLVTRKKLGNQSKVYWALLLIGLVIVGLTGHFGGQMVYG